MKGRRRFISASGFTLMELVIAMSIGSLLVGFIALMITAPVQAYMAQSRRAQLSDSGQTAMRSMSVEIRKALPNSVRTRAIGSVAVLEMIDVAEIANYRTTWNTGEPLTLHAPDDVFDLTTSILNALPPNPRLVVGNARDAAHSAYRTDGGSGVITPTTSTIAFDGANQARLKIAPAFTFTNDSARQRVYVVTTVTRFECDPGAGELRRYRNLPITDAIGSVAAPFDVIARDVSACSFRVLDGTTEHGGIAILEVTFARVVDGRSESSRIVRQVRVENPA